MIVRLGAIGDVVRTLPALHALREGYPRAHIGWLVEPAAKEVLEDVSELDQILCFPRDRLTKALRSFDLRALRGEISRFVSALREPQFDVVIDFHAILKSGILSRLTGAATRISYAMPVGRECSWIFANRRARLTREKISRYARNLALVEYMNLSASTPDLPLHVALDARENMTRALQGREVTVLIHPGSSGGAAYKRYPASGYADLARALSRERKITSMVISGSSIEERALAESIVRASEGAAVLAPETPGLKDLVALLGSAQVFVGSDSGPLHLATSLGTPSVQILGPTDPVENQPLPGARWRQVRVPVACSPCRRGCAAATCMRVVPHELVLEATLGFLSPASCEPLAPAVDPPLSASPAVAASWN